MAKYREPEYCPNCGKQLEATHRNMGIDFVGDSFVGYKKCSCYKAENSKPDGKDEYSEPMVAVCCANAISLLSDTVHKYFAGHVDSERMKLNFIDAIDQIDSASKYMTGKPVFPVSNTPEGNKDRKKKQIEYIIYEVYNGDEYPHLAANRIINLLNSGVDSKGIDLKLAGEIWDAACTKLLSNMEDCFLNPDHLNQAEKLRDREVFQALGETIKQFPIPDKAAYLASLVTTQNENK